MQIQKLFKFQSQCLFQFLILGFFSLLTACGNGICDNSTNGKCAATPAAGLSCPVIQAGNSTSMNSALTTISSDISAANTITTTMLTVPGDSMSFNSAGTTKAVYRILPSTDFNSGTITAGSYTTSINVPLAVFNGTSATTIDHSIFIYNTNILSDYYAPSTTWHSPLAGYRAIDSSSSTVVEFNSLSTSGNPVTVALPCDTSSCTTDCTCRCYQWSFTSNLWTRTNISTTQTSATTVNCTSYLPKAFVSVFAVNNGCE